MADKPDTAYLRMRLYRERRRGGAPVDVRKELDLPRIFAKPRKRVKEGELEVFMVLDNGSVYTIGSVPYKVDHTEVHGGMSVIVNRSNVKDPDIILTAYDFEEIMGADFPTEGRVHQLHVSELRVAIPDNLAIGEFLYVTMSLDRDIIIEDGNKGDTISFYIGGSGEDAKIMAIEY